MYYSLGQEIDFLTELLATLNNFLPGFLYNYLMISCYISTCVILLSVNQALKSGRVTSIKNKYFSEKRSLQCLHECNKVEKRTY